MRESRNVGGSTGLSQPVTNGDDQSTGSHFTVTSLGRVKMLADRPDRVLSVTDGTVFTRV